MKDILQPQLEGVITEDMLKDFVGRVMEDYQEFALKQENPDDFNTNFRAYLETDAVSRILSEELAGIKDKLSGVTITDDQIKEILTDLANGYGEYAKANNLVYHLFTVEINRINGNRLRVILVSISHFIQITFIRNRAGCHKGCHQLL